MQVTARCSRGRVRHAMPRSCLQYQPVFLIQVHRVVTHTLVHEAQQHGVQVVALPRHAPSTWHQHANLRVIIHKVPGDSGDLSNHAS